MDEKSLRPFNAVMIILICLIVVFSWLYLRWQFAWGILLVVLLLLFAGYVNVARRFPWEGMSAADGVVALGAVLMMGFAWFYMREQFCWAGCLVIFILAFVEFLKLKRWLKDVISIQVIVHKNEKDEGKKEK